MDQFTGCSAAPVTETYTMHCFSLNLLHGHFFEPKWSDDEVSLLAESATKFKKQAHETFSNYRASQMGT